MDMVWEVDRGDVCGAVCASGAGVAGGEAVSCGRAWTAKQEARKHVAKTRMTTRGRRNVNFMGPLSKRSRDAANASSRTTRPAPPTERDRRSARQNANDTETRGFSARPRVAHVLSAGIPVANL